MRGKTGFTMLELLVSTTVLILLLAILSRALTQSEGVWDRGRGRIRLLASGRAALGVIRDDLECAFPTNVFALVDDESAVRAPHSGNVTWVSASQTGYDIEKTYGAVNAGLFFYRFAPAPREGCYPVEAVCLTVTNRTAGSGANAFDLPVLVRHVVRFTIAQEEPREEAETFDWERDTRDDLVPDELLPPAEPLPGETALGTPEATRETTMELLEGVAAIRCIPRSLATDDEDGGPIDAVDLYLELLTPGQCKRIARLPDQAQAEFAAKNAVKLSARIPLRAHPAFDAPADPVPIWETTP